MSRHTFFATCAPGVEPLLFAEVKALKLGRPEQQVGGVRFEGELPDAWRANLWLRTAVRVLWRLARFEARDGDELYRQVAETDWSKHLLPQGTLWVDAQTKDSSLDHSQFVAQRVKDAIVDNLRSDEGERPTVVREGCDLRVHLHLWRDRATLSLDTSGDSLHKRGWRRAQGRAPLAETLAAAVVLASGWDQRGPLVDPFCGSGTILVEAGLLASNAAPGSFRERFGFERWPSHDAAAYARVKALALAERRTPRKLTLIGTDLDPARIEDARANVEAAGLSDLVELGQADARKFAPRAGWNAWVVTNPPYGERIGNAAELHQLYVTFGRQLREHCTGYHLGLLSGNPRLASALGLGSIARRPFQNGAIACEVLAGELR